MTAKELIGKLDSGWAHIDDVDRLSASYTDAIKKNLTLVLNQVKLGVGCPEMTLKEIGKLYHRDDLRFLFPMLPTNAVDDCTLQTIQAYQMRTYEAWNQAYPTHVPMHASCVCRRAWAVRRHVSQAAGAPGAMFTY